MAAVLGPLYKYPQLIPENVQLIFVPFLSCWSCSR